MLEPSVLRLPFGLLHLAVRLNHILLQLNLMSVSNLTLVEKGSMVPVHLGHWSRLLNRDPLLGTNAGPGSSTNRDR
jgi:hypothetical protein